MPTRSEYQLKAVFLLNFLQFIEWPDSAFTNKDAPLRVGVVGEDPFGDTLDAAVRGEKVRGHSLELHRIAYGDDLQSYEILFLTGTNKDRIADALRRAKDRPILTIGDTEGFAECGGMINFVMADRKVRFEINPGAARQQGLKVSSKLLQLGKVATTQDKK